MRNLVLLIAMLLIQAVVQPYKAMGQSKLVIDLSSIDGIDITPDNILNYQVQSLFNAPVNAKITGQLRFRGSAISLSYACDYVIRPGMNTINKDIVNIQWQYSSGSLKELFQLYKKLPQGIYEYCVTISQTGQNSEILADDAATECLFNKSEDIFMIMLIDPENDAKIYEANPMLSWAVNSPISGLAYRLRVTEVKDDQNNANAINRNNPVYMERNLMQTSQVYPVYAKPLKKYQPYAWTVDAYYKDLLLGGAEPWRFTIIEDTLIKLQMKDQSYYEFEKHPGDTRLSITGEARLKYTTDKDNDTLFFKLFDNDNNEMKLPNPVVSLKAGDNRVNIILHEHIAVADGKRYSFLIENTMGRKYILPFTYHNPQFINE